MVYLWSIVSLLIDIYWSDIDQWTRPIQSFDAVAFFRAHRLAIAIVGGCLLLLALIRLSHGETMGRVLAFLRRQLSMTLGAQIVLAVVVALWILGESRLAIAIVGGCLLLLALIRVPRWQATRPDLTPREQFEVENTARKTLAEIVGGVALLAGLYFTWSSVEVNREGQVTERFTKAIAQLGAVNGKGERQLEIRLGGIYALERIARDSRRDHWPIMEVLTAYIREHAPWPPKDTPPPQNHASPNRDPAAAQGQPPPKLATDIEAILTVLSRRDRTYEEDNQHLDLRGTDLRGAFLWRTHLQ